MARLTTKKRKSLPKSDFALLGRKYPMPDKTHARVAKAYASRYATPAQRAIIDAKANKILGEKKMIKKIRKHINRKGQY
jgi:hypothetical protein